MNRRNIVSAGALALALFATSASAAQPLDVQIRWTSYGVPHVEARDFESLGYGYGYAVAPHRLCLLADRVITLRGERSRWFGAEGRAVVGFLPTTNLSSDLFHRVQLADDMVAAATAALSVDARALARGDALDQNGYGAIVAGSAYVQLVRWEGANVIAEVVLAHGQSQDRASAHRTDQLEIFAQKRLARMPFSAAQVAADTVRMKRLTRP